MMKPGAHLLDGQGCEFLVWAPYANRVVFEQQAPVVRSLPMHDAGKGNWHLLLDDVTAGSDYFYRIDNGEQRPDPASAHQPAGVHGPSRVVNHAAFAWSDQAWQGIPQEQLVIYELHVGSFSPAGTFDAIIPRLAALAELGITAIELMPVGQFPGTRNWGYDVAFPFAVQHSYGGPQGLKRLIDACHGHGLGVILDVVYNHFGPEGNYLHEFGPYLTDRYATPWGEAINFDGPDNGGVRRYFIENALYWFDKYHVDILRLDAVHAIHDASELTFLQELAAEVARFGHRSGRPRLLIAESDDNDARLIRSPKSGGYGLDGHWNDDFHHALHALLTEESHLYYQDFDTTDHLAKAFHEGFVYTGQYSRYRQRHHGSSTAECHGRQLVVFSQNHDQIGNRPAGERLITLAGFEAAKLAAAAVMLAPCIPLIFMGEEYGEDAPFLYFVDFTDEQLNAAVRDGRNEDFREVPGKGATPPPADTPEALRHSRLDWDKHHTGRSKVMHEFYRTLLRLRRKEPALASLDMQGVETLVLPGQELLILQRNTSPRPLLGLLNFNHHETCLNLPCQPGTWRKLIDSADPCWLGPGTQLPDPAIGSAKIYMAPLSAALYALEYRRPEAQ